jgi:hypothetical protein
VRAHVFPRGNFKAQESRGAFDSDLDG